MEFLNLYEPILTIKFENEEITWDCYSEESNFIIFSRGFRLSSQNANCALETVSKFIGGSHIRWIPRLINTYNG